MSGLTCANCGICLYFSNSAAQVAASIGGIAPVTGFHSVMDSPEPVSRVAPPSAIIATTMTNSSISQTRTQPRPVLCPASIIPPAGVLRGVVSVTS